MTSTMTDTTPIQIFDTTLRDGEQSPGAAMTHEEKLQIAELLDEMGVDIIEAGFAIASPGDFKAVQEIAKIVKRASVCSLSRAGFKDIDRAGEAVKGAHRPRIHTFISTSPVHMKHKLNMGENAVLEAIGASVTRARNYTSEVEWSAEDATRTVPDFLCKCVDVAINAGAYYSGTALDYGKFGVYATPKPGKTLRDVETALDGVLVAVCEDGITADELSLAKNRLIADVIYAQDNQTTLARWYGAALATGETVEMVRSWPDDIRAVTADAVREAARTWLNRRASVTGYLVNSLEPQEKHS